jgi:hypothetical protein
MSNGGCVEVQHNPLDTEEEKYREEMIEVNGGFQLAIVKYKDDVDRLKSSIEDRKNAIEDRKYMIEKRANEFLISTDHANENHGLVRKRMLKLNQEEFDMCMEFVDTEEEKTVLRLNFKKKMTDIMNDNLDQHSTKKLISSRGVQDSDGLLSVTVDHVIAKAVIQENNKRDREQAKIQQAEGVKERKVAREARKHLKAHTEEIRRAMRS